MAIGPHLSFLKIHGGLEDGQSLSVLSLTCIFLYATGNLSKQIITKSLCQKEKQYMYHVVQQENILDKYNILI